jgi:hypothetical protein
VKVTKFNRSLYQLSPSMRRTEGTGSGLLHTPSAQEPGVNPDRLVTKEGGPAKVGERAYDKKTGRLAQVGLPQQIKMLPTPTSSDATTGAIIGKNDTFRQTKGLPLKVNQNGKDGSVGLGRLVQMLPTPDSHMERGVAKNWNPIRPSGAHASFPLNEAVAGTKTGLKLQPGFALWMMGYPTDWCDLKDGEMPPSKARGTRGSRK